MTAARRRAPWGPRRKGPPGPVRRGRRRSRRRPPLLPRAWARRSRRGRRPGAQAVQHEEHYEPEQKRRQGPSEGPPRPLYPSYHFEVLDIDDRNDATIYFTMFASAFVRTFLAMSVLPTFYCLRCIYISYFEQKIYWTKRET